MADIHIPTELEIHEIAYLTIRGWLCSASGWKQTGKHHYFDLKQAVSQQRALDKAAANTAHPELVGKI